MRNIHIQMLIPRVTESIVWVPTRFLLWFFGRFSVKGKGHLRGLPQAIFAVNHSSELDGIILAAALNPFGRFMPMFYVARPRNFYSEEHFKWRRYIYKEWFFYLWGAYPAQPGLKDYAKSLAPHREILKQGGNLCIFPEGRLTRTGHIGEVHGGIGYLALITGIPVVPVAISGTFRLSTSKLFSRKGKITVSFGAPIKYEKIDLYTPERCKEIANQVMGRVATMLSLPVQ